MRRTSPITTALLLAAIFLLSGCAARELAPAANPFASEFSYPDFETQKAHVRRLFHDAAADASTNPDQILAEAVLVACRMAIEQVLAEEPERYPAIRARFEEMTAPDPGHVPAFVQRMRDERNLAGLRAAIHLLRTMPLRAAAAGMLADIVEPPDPGVVQAAAKALSLESSPRLGGAETMIEQEALRRSLADLLHRASGGEIPADRMDRSVALSRPQLITIPFGTNTAAAARWLEHHK